MSKIFNFRIDDVTKDKLEYISNHHNRSKGNMIVRMIQKEYEAVKQ